MKTKVIVLFVLLSGSMAAHSQILKGGVNVANISITNDGSVDEAKMINSFQVGLLANVKILPFISFQPGILFTGKGSKTQSGVASEKPKPEVVFGDG